MSLKIVFGWHLDGLSYPESLNNNTFNTGGLVIGPQGLAQQLALRLGILKPFLRQSVRIARYMQILQEIDNGNQFFSQSLSIDPWSTASRLLVMRDQLVAAGWQGKALEGETPKLQSIRLAEQCTNSLGSPSETTRTILTTLRKMSPRVKSLPIESIDIYTNPAYLPPTWQEILMHLRESGIAVKPINRYSMFSKDRDLGKVQTFLETGEKNALSNDGSICLLEADDEFQLADTVSTWLMASGSDLKHTVILRNAPTIVLDAFCRRRGLPRIGGYGKSRWRSALQVLPLMLESCWTPPNPQVALKLITLPEGPIPKSISHHFVKALRIEPGFGGERWSSAWIAVKKQLESTELAEVSILNAGSSTKIATTLKNLESWLQPIRHDPNEGIPCDQAITICRQVSKWASFSAQHESQSDIFIQAATYARELEDTLTESGLSKVKKIQLDRMLDAVAGEGCEPGSWCAEAANWSLVDHPGQIWGTTNTLLWWGFHSSSTAKVPPNLWSNIEYNLLKSVGVLLEKPELMLTREADSWRQSLFQVQDQVLLCHSHSASGQLTSSHPFCQELEEVENFPSVRKQTHDLLKSSTVLLSSKVLPTVSLDLRNPPAAIRYWNVPSNMITQRSTESVSSLKELFGCPMAWILRYYAQLHPTVLLSLPDSDRLLGDIAHVVFRRLFERENPHHEIERLAEVLFDEQIESVGLPLLQRGRSLERNRAKRTIASAAKDFSKFLNEANLEVDACEIRREASFLNGQFVGDLDAVLKQNNNSKFIVDYKWTKNLKYRLEEIEQGKQIQLAAYAWLESESTGAQAQAGYYMLRQRRLLHCSDINKGQLVESKSLSAVWNLVKKTYLAQISILESGTICAEGVLEESTNDFQTIEDIRLDPPCKVCDYGNICGKTRQADD